MIGDLEKISLLIILIPLFWMVNFHWRIRKIHKEIYPNLSYWNSSWNPQVLELFAKPYEQIKNKESAYRKIFPKASLEEFMFLRSCGNYAILPIGIIILINKINKISIAKEKAGEFLMFLAVLVFICTIYFLSVRFANYQLNRILKNCIEYDLKLDRDAKLLLEKIVTKWPKLKKITEQYYIVHRPKTKDQYKI